MQKNGLSIWNFNIYNKKIERKSCQKLLNIQELWNCNLTLKYRTWCLANDGKQKGGATADPAISMGQLQQANKPNGLRICQEKAA